MSWRWKLDRSVISSSDLLHYCLYYALIKEKLSGSRLRPQSLKPSTCKAKIPLWTHLPSPFRLEVQSENFWLRF